MLEGSLEHLRPRAPSRGQARPREPKRGTPEIPCRGHKTGLLGCSNGERAILEGSLGRAQERPLGHKMGFPVCSNGERAILEGSLEHLRPSSAESPGEAW
jgi:hypothetical protein